MDILVQPIQGQNVKVFKVIGQEQVSERIVAPQVSMVIPQERCRNEREKSSWRWREVWSIVEV